MTTALEVRPRRSQLVVANDADATAIGDLIRKSRRSYLDGVRCLIEAGHRLKAKKAKLKQRGGKWLPWLQAHAEVLGLGEAPERQAQRLMRAADKYDASVVLDETEALQISREVYGHLVRGTAGTGEFERYTPAQYIAVARAVLGGIDLDPASCEIAQQAVEATRYFTLQDDGLVREWHGRVWLNPPYHRDLGPAFVKKLIAERAAGHVTAAIMLTNNATDTAWFADAAAACDAISFTRGRINFLKEDGETPVLPTQGQTFFYFGPNVERFKRGFADDVGFVVLPVRERRDERPRLIHRHGGVD